MESNGNVKVFQDVDNSTTEGLSPFYYKVQMTVSMNVESLVYIYIYALFSNKDLIKTYLLCLVLIERGRGNPLPWPMVSAF